MASLPAVDAVRTFCAKVREGTTGRRCEERRRKFVRWNGVINYGTLSRKMHLGAHSQRLFIASPAPNAPWSI